MTRLLRRTIAWVLAGAVAAWAGRLVAHSKVPPPEGRWRELDAEELA